MIELYKKYMVDWERIMFMGKPKAQIKSIEHWREKLTPEEKRKLYLKSIPQQVSASMAFEGEPVSMRMLTKYLKTLKDTPQPLVS